MFVSRTARPPSHIPYARFRAALDGGDLGFVRRYANELAPIKLRDALVVCLLVRDQEPERLERASVRWVGRFALEAPAASMADLRRAWEALDALPREPERSMELLAALCVEHGLGS
jgi:hypothetical protein